MYQIILGRIQLKGQEIIHRDMNLSNIFLHNKICKIADFGFSKKCADNFQSFGGTSSYIAWEFTQPNVKKTYKVDIWSMGCI
jgi:p38 MAP kinase